MSSHLSFRSPWAFKRYIWGLGILSGMLLLPLFFVSAYSTDFESFNLGSVNGQQGWTAAGYPAKAAQITEANATSGIKSLRFYDSDDVHQELAGSATTSPVSVGEMSMNYWRISGTSSGRLYFLFDTGSPWLREISGGLYVFNNSSQWVLAAPGTIASQTWTPIKFQWDDGAQASERKFRLKVGENEWGQWWTAAQRYSNPSLIISYFEFDFDPVQSSSGYVYIDDFVFGVPYTPQTGYDLILTPTNPPIGFSQQDFTNFIVNGKIEIPTEFSSTTWNWLRIEFDDSEYATDTRYNSDWLDLPDLQAGEFYDYSATTSVATSSPAFEMTYWAYGFNNSTGEIIFSKWIKLSTIYQGATIPNKIISEADLPEIPGCSDCSGLSGIEKWTCQTERILCQIFLPSIGKVNETKNIIREIEKKAPVNYIKAVSGFFLNIKNGIDTGQSLSFKIWGQSGTTNFDFLDATSSIAGITQKFSDILKFFLYGIFILVFVVWALSFIRKLGDL